MAARVTISFDQKKNRALTALREAIERQHGIDFEKEHINVHAEVEAVQLKDGVRFDILLTGDCMFEGSVKIPNSGDVVTSLSNHFNLPQPKPIEQFA